MLQKPQVWICTSAGGCITSLIDWSMPYLQFIAVVLTIAAGIRAWIISGKKDK